MSRSAIISPGIEGEMNLCSAHWDWAAGEDECGGVSVVRVDRGGDWGGGGEGLIREASYGSTIFATSNGCF